MRRLILMWLFFVFLFGCGTTTKYVAVQEKVIIPKPPKVVVMDNGKIDKRKYKETDWVKKPRVDLKKRRACWDFDDVEKISRSLTDWPDWGREVEKIIEIHNRSLNEPQGLIKKKSWYRFWE